MMTIMNDGYLMKKGKCTRHFRKMVLFLEYLISAQSIVINFYYEQICMHRFIYVCYVYHMHHVHLKYFALVYSEHNRVIINYDNFYEETYIELSFWRDKCMFSGLSVPNNYIERMLKFLDNT